jgi:hypothetical protein
MDAWSALLLGQPKWSGGNVEDRTYMTSPYNPFTKAADRFSITKGYYIPHTTPTTERPTINLSPAELEKLNKAFEEYIRQNQAPRR